MKPPTPKSRNDAWLTPIGGVIDDFGVCGNVALVEQVTRANRVLQVHESVEIRLTPAV
jgi:hypothetical protein